MFWKKDLDKSNDYLSEIVAESRRKNLAVANRTSETKKELKNDIDNQIEVELEGITLVTHAVPPLNLLPLFPFLELPTTL